MPGLKKHRISKRMVDGLSVHGKSAVYWDRDLPGFGVRVYRSGRKTYVVQSRGPKGSRRVTIGRHGEVTAQQARKHAAAIIGRIKAGEAPRPESAEPVAEPTVADLAERYLRTHVAVECKPSSERSYRKSLAHILPVLGDMPVGSVEREHVASLHLAMRDTPVAANMVLWVLSKMFSLAEVWALRAPGRNPCRSVRRYRTPRRDRFLSREEYRRVGRVLQRAEADGSAWPPAVAAVRLLMLTGCRSREVATLRWDDVDVSAGKLRLRDSKSGPRMVALTPTAVQVLEGIRRIDGNPWVFAGACAAFPRGQPLQSLESSSGEGGSFGRAAARSAPLLCLARPGAGRELVDDRQAAGAFEGGNDGAIRASCAGHGEGVGGAHRRQHRGGHPSGCRPGGGGVGAAERDCSGRTPQG